MDIESRNKQILKIALCLILHSHTHKLLVESHKTKFLSPLELLYQLRVAKFRDLVIPNSESQRL